MTAPKPKRRLPLTGAVVLGIYILFRPYNAVAILLGFLLGFAVLAVISVKRGGLQIMRAAFGRMDKPALFIRILALVLFAGLAFLWPDAGLLALCVVFAAGLIVYDIRVFRQFLRGTAFTLPEKPRVLFARLRSGSLLLLAVLFTVMSTSARLAVPRIDAFYTWDEAIPAPGTILRVEAVTMADESVRAWRILYSTTRDAANTPDVASAMVFAPQANEALSLIAWAHGTIGIVPHAAPSVALSLDAQMAAIPAFGNAMANGWAIVAPDYAGLGAGGRTHGYLIGEDEACSVLDAIRAAQTLDGLALTGETVVWGHSQGGHAAIWAGILAPSYAPELAISGIAAAAPATDLPALLWNSKEHFVGNALGAFALYAYDAAYPDIQAAELVKWNLRPVAKSLAFRSVGEPATLVSVVTALAIRGSIYNRLGDLMESAYHTRLVENIPDRPVAAPLFIAQGADDPLITRAIQDAFVERLRTAGQVLEYAVYPGDHMGVLDLGNGFPADLAAWTQNIFAVGK